jgi:hypothetical protein
MGLEYRHPIAEPWYIGQDCEWGNRASWRSYPPHAGVDYNVSGGSSGKTIRAIAIGTIRGKGWSGTYGNRVWIQHDDGMWSHYAHMLSPCSRNDGDRVNVGDPIGAIGNTGSASNGAHLHLELAHSQWACNDGNQSIDPIAFINNNPGTPTPVIPPEDGMTHSISVNGALYAVGQQFLSHHGTIAQATVTRNVTSATDELHELTPTQFKDLRDGLGIPQTAINAAGNVLNPETGGYAANGVWSRERELLAEIKKLG